MPKTIKWSKAAEHDFGIIVEYLSNNWSNQIASKFINKIDNCILLISEDFKLFPIINEKLQVRKCVVTKHNTLYYRGNNSTVEIIRLFDSRQDPKKLIFR